MRKQRKTITVLLIGAGNIGSQLGPLIARISKIDRIVIIDPDSYDESNLASQNILPGQVGMPKAEVLARSLQSINPELQMSHHSLPVQATPLGAFFGANLVVCCVDNRSARQAINQRAWRIGVPWLDTAVDPDNSLARVNLYVPGTMRACLECAWTEEDFAHLESSYSCTGTKLAAPNQQVPPTAAPAELGAFAAALACMQIRDILNGNTGLAGHQLLMDVRFHRQFLAKLPFNEQCRFDHESWRIEELHESPKELTLAQAFHLFSHESGGQAPHHGVSLRQEGQTFVHRLNCTACGTPGRKFLHLSDRLQPRQLRCHRCGGRRAATGFDREPELAAAGLSSTWLAKTMGELGYTQGDIFSLVTGRRARHFQLSAIHG